MWRRFVVGTAVLHPLVPHCVASRWLAVVQALHGPAVFDQAKDTMLRTFLNPYQGVGPP